MGTEAFGASANVAVILFVLLVLIFVVIPVSVHLLVHFSALTAEGTVTDIRGLPNGGVKADWSIQWTLGLPLLGDVALQSDSEKAFNPEPHKMDTAIRVPNYSPAPIWLHPTDVSVYIPELDGGQQSLVDMRTPDVVFPPGNQETTFKTWINISSIERAESVVTQHLASGSGGKITLRMNPSLTVWWLSFIHLDVCKQMQCKVTPLEPPAPAALISSGRGALRRSPRSRPGALLLEAGLGGGGSEEWAPKFRDIDLACAYAGNV